MKTNVFLLCCLFATALRAPAQVSEAADGRTADTPAAQSADTAGAQSDGSESTHAGYVPVLTGSLGYVYNVNGGVPTLLPQINPVGLVAVGKHALFETSAQFTGFFQRRNGTTGDYHGQVFKSVGYVQLDWLADTHAIGTAGRYIAPFGLYPERVAPLWIANIQEIPLIYSIGALEGGYGLGPMLRGVAIEKPDFNVQYSAYYSVHYTQNYLGTRHAAGGDASIYFKNRRAELGSSYQRFLDGPRFNNEAVYLAWQPFPANLDVKAQYSHSYYGQGYWIEGYNMLTWAPVAPNFFSRMQVVGRAEEVSPLNGGGNGVPTLKVKRGETALNYYIRDDWRLVSSFARQSNAGRQFNIWDLGFTYRFVWPLGREKK